jgi:hypothetical protein
MIQVMEWLRVHTADLIVGFAAVMTLNNLFRCDLGYYMVMLVDTPSSCMACKFNLLDMNTLGLFTLRERVSRKVSLIFLLCYEPNATPPQCSPRDSTSHAHS